MRSFLFPSTERPRAESARRPHPALPRHYFGYNDSYGGPAGDYLGAISQMDEQACRPRLRFVWHVSRWQRQLLVASLPAVSLTPLCGFVSPLYFAAVRLPRIHRGKCVPCLYMRLS